MKILKLFKKYFCLTAVSIALLGLVLAGWKFSLQADNICSNAVSNCIHALIEFTFCACLAA